MAKDGRVSVVEGMWLSSAILLPLGIFFTYKAVHDSGVFNIDAYKALWAKLRGKHKRTLEPKEFTLNEVTPHDALEVIEAFDRDLKSFRDTYRSMFPLRKPIVRLFGTKQSAECMRSMNVLIDYLANSRSYQVISILNKYPYKISPRDFNLLVENNGLLRQWFAAEEQKEQKQGEYE